MFSAIRNIVAVVWLWEGWILPSLIAQGSFQTRYVEGTGQVVNYATTLKPHPVMRLLLLMMMIMILRKKLKSMLEMQSDKILLISTRIPVRLAVTWCLVKDTKSYMPVGFAYEVLWLSSLLFYNQRSSCCKFQLTKMTNMRRI